MHVMSSVGEQVLLLLDKMVINIASNVGLVSLQLCNKQLIC